MAEDRNDNATQDNAGTSQQDRVNPAGGEGQPGMNQEHGRSSDALETGTDQPSPGNNRQSGAGEQSSSGQWQSDSGSRESMTENRESESETSQGFIGSEGSGSDDLIEDGQGSRNSGQASSAGATGGADFAKQGRGALDDEEGQSSSPSGGNSN